MILLLFAIGTGLIVGIAADKDNYREKCHYEYVKQIDSTVKVCKKVGLK